MQATQEVIPVFIDYPGKGIALLFEASMFKQRIPEAMQPQRGWGEDPVPENIGNFWIRIPRRTIPGSREVLIPLAMQAHASIILDLEEYHDLKVRWDSEHPAHTLIRNLLNEPGHLAHLKIMDAETINAVMYRPMYFIIKEKTQHG